MKRMLKEVSCSMKSSVLGLTVGIALASVSSLLAPRLQASEGTFTPGGIEGKTLPTLLIKGEVVSIDTADPNATLLKVKDRYGFETPIFLAPETKITQGDQTLTAANLATGTAVEVEYNFDVNTAKRHAVSVKLAQPATPAAEVSSAPAAAPAAPMPPAVEPSIEPAPSQTPAEPAPSESNTEAPAVQ